MEYTIDGLHDFIYFYFEIVAEKILYAISCAFGKDGQV